MELMIDRGYQQVTVADVLDRAGLSTRSFYRHFESKDRLLADLLRREVDSVSRELDRAVADGATPADSVHAWIDTFLDTFFEPRRAIRSSAFTTGDVLTASALRDQLDEIRSTLCRSLVEALAAGHATGALTSPLPALDAACIFGLLTSAVQTHPRPSRTTTRHRILGFVDPALGVDEA